MENDERHEVERLRANHDALLVLLKAVIEPWAWRTDAELADMADMAQRNEEASRVIAARAAIERAEAG